MVKSGQIDTNDVNVVFVGMHGESTATNRRLLSGCNDCGVQLLQDGAWSSGNNLWVALDGVKDSFYVYGADGRLQDEFREGLDLKGSGYARDTLLATVGVPTKQPTAWPSTKYPTRFPTRPVPRNT